MDSYKGQVFEAEVKKINPVMNAQSKSFLVEAVFLTPPPALYPNLTTEANIIIAVKDKVLTIPRKVEIISGLTKNDVILKPE